MSSVSSSSSSAPYVSPSVRRRISALFSLFDRDSKGVCPKEEVGTIMRALNLFPTEDELITDILPALQSEFDRDSSVIEFVRFEPFIIRCLSEGLYAPDNEETLLRAFKCLDVDNRGYFDEATMVELLTSNEWPLKARELEDFLRVAKDPDTGYIHYEDYIHLLTN
jgi:Ca2+-binding EF-hand superfamily protein